MIVELTGLPGSGKSYILSKMKEVELKDLNLVTDIPFFLLGKCTGARGNWLIYELFLLSQFLRLKLSDWRIVLESIRFLRMGSEGFLTRCNILRNILKKLITYRLLEHTSEIVIVDEGISHIPMSLFVQRGLDIKEDEVINFITLLPNVDKLIQVVASQEIVLSRVVQRGFSDHRRISINNIFSFLLKSRQVADIITREYNPQKIINEEILLMY